MNNEEESRGCMTQQILPDPGTVSALRTVIRDFLQERFQEKLKDAKNNSIEKQQQLKEIYQVEYWVADAAKRVSRIQQVTHAIKFTHPAIKGCTSLSVQGNTRAGDILIGTHTVKSNFFDVVANARDLDVYKFLCLEVGNKTLLTFCLEEDVALKTALSADEEQAKNWMAAFAGLVQQAGTAAKSHTLAKQIYWPVDKGNYHLLAPLFPTSLVHGIWNTIREDRFSETAKAAREARKAGALHPHGYREYPNLVIQQFGGTKPQNISQLNSERYGENYLLPSLPPNWQSEKIRPPLKIESVFDRVFGSRKRVKELTKELKDFLIKVQPFNNVEIRDTRADLVNEIRDELFQFAAELYELEEGWSQHEDCRLNIDEQCWLDPQRAKTDEAFASLSRSGGWQNGVSQRFGNWLNARITSSTVPMGEAEAEAWQRVLSEALNMIRIEVDFYE